MLPFPVVVGAIVILFASLVAQRRLIDELVDHDWNILVFMLLSAAVGYGPSVLWMWFISRRWGTGRMRADLGVRFRWQDLGWGPLIWFGTHVAVAIAVLTMRALEVPYRGNLEAQAATSPERTAVISLVISAVVFAPIVEEALFRGVVMRGLLSKTKPPVAIALQGILFGAAHLQPDFGRDSVGLVIALSVAGIGFGFGCYMLRRLGPVMIAHACFNGLAITVLLNEVY